MFFYYQKAIRALLIDVLLSRQKSMVQIRLLLLSIKKVSVSLRQAFLRDFKMLWKEPSSSQAIRLIYGQVWRQLMLSNACHESSTNEFFQVINRPHNAISFFLFMVTVCSSSRSSSSSGSEVCYRARQQLHQHPVVFSFFRNHRQIDSGCEENGKTGWSLDVNLLLLSNENPQTSTRSGMSTGRRRKERNLLSGQQTPIRDLDDDRLVGWVFFLSILLHLPMQSTLLRFGCRHSSFFSPLKRNRRWRKNVPAVWLQNAQ